MVGGTGLEPVTSPMHRGALLEGANELLQHDTTLQSLQLPLSLNVPRVADVEAAITLALQDVDHSANGHVLG